MTDSSPDVSKLTVADLKKELLARGLPTIGQKAELLQRLTGAIAAKALSTPPQPSAKPSIETVGTIVTPDAQQPSAAAKGVLPQRAKVAAVGTKKLSPVSTVPPSSALTADTTIAATIMNDTVQLAAEVSGAASAPTAVVKKLKNRSVISADKQPAAAVPSSAAASSVTAVALEPVDVMQESAATDPAAKLIRLCSKDSAQSSVPPLNSSKLAERATRFGSANVAPSAAPAPTVDNDDKIALRVARFGFTDKKAERAARFGSSASTTASVSSSIAVATTTITKEPVSTEEAERIRKRKERFGASEPAMEQPNVDERKKLRAERFGSAALGVK